MKSLLNIGGGILLVILLLSKKKEVVNPDIKNETPPIIPPIAVLPPSEARVDARVEPTNASFSPTLTTYEVSDTEKLINALNELKPAKKYY